MKMLKAPVRIFDTRHEKSGALKSNSTTKIDVPSDVKSESMFITVTAINAREKGFITVWSGEGERPTASCLNYDSGVTVANTTGVLAKGGTSFKVYAKGATDLAIDVVTVD
jgi:hypothetical protein